MNFTHSNLSKAVALSAWVLGTSLVAHATEGGVSMYPNGTENFMAGALPPPGLYGMVYANHYEATQVNDNSGNSLNTVSYTHLDVYKRQVLRRANRLHHRLGGLHAAA